MTSTLTRNTVLSIAAGLLSANTVATLSAAPPVSHKGNGSFLELSGSDSTGCRGLYLYASRGGTPQAPDTYLFYSIYDWCTNETIALGDGLIANASLKTTRKSATLTITPSASSTFFTEGLAGTINMTLKADGLYATSFSGHQRSEQPDVLYQSHGSWRSRTATFAGTVLGFDFGNAWAWLGESRDKYMEIQRRSK